MIAMSIIAVSAIIITGRTLVAYADYAPLWKFVAYVLISLAWFAPVIIWNLRSITNMSAGTYGLIVRGGYYMFGLAFIVVSFILLRDIVWGLAYLVSGKQIVSPGNPEALHWANMITLVLAFILSLYAVYSAEKLPRVLHYEYHSERIKQPMKVLFASDLHINRAVSVQKVEKIVRYFNELKPDVVLLGGDIADDNADEISAQIKALKKIKALYGVYYVLGNHETYFDAFRWEAEFASLGWQVLHNSGGQLGSSGVYVAGLPDNRRFGTSVKQALKNSAPDSYRILMSHIPSVVSKIGDEAVDIQVSGHTHGGQIFPFNFMAKAGNAGFVFGEYTVNNIKLLISRGVGYWGPPMRLGAPNDVIMIDLKPQEKKN